MDTIKLCFARKMLIGHFVKAFSKFNKISHGPDFSLGRLGWQSAWFTWPLLAEPLLEYQGGYCVWSDGVLQCDGKCACIICIWLMCASLNNDFLLLHDFLSWTLELQWFSSKMAELLLDQEMFEVAKLVLVIFLRQFLWRVEQVCRLVQ